MHSEEAFFMEEGGAVIPDSNAVFFDHVCNVLPGPWTLIQNGNSTVTLDPAPAFLIASGAHNIGNIGSVTNNSAFPAPAAPTQIVISRLLQIDHLGNQGALLEYVGGIVSFNTSRILNYQLWADKIGIQDSSAVMQYYTPSTLVPVGPDPFLLLFDIDATTGLCDVYIKGVLVLSGIDCNRGNINIGRWTSSVVNRQTVDYTEMNSKEFVFKSGDGYA